MINIANPQKPTPRQFQVGELWAMGWISRQIAEELYISIRTVESHVVGFYDATGCEDRRDTCRWFVANVWQGRCISDNWPRCHSFEHTGLIYTCSVPFDAELRVNIVSEA